jgi:UDP-N-acetylglucosamine 4,6-dehydratase
VIPLFIAQRQSGCVTVTDERMTRFWITLDQGVRFVLRAIEQMFGGEVFVPKIPSMRITDLVSAMAPGCKVTFTGIRPGEKVHEALLSDHEAAHTLEFDDMFVVQPEFGWWTRGKWQSGTPLPDGFRYTSDANTEWLSIDELCRMADEVVAV